MMKIFVVFDSKSEGYGIPFFQRTTGEALRGFTEAVNDPQKQSAVAKYPQDFTLFELGEYDELLGNLAPYNHKKSLVCGVDVLQAVDPSPLRQVT